MTYSRVFGILDLELNQHLSFAFSIQENVTRPGSSWVRPGDRFYFLVWAINNSAIPLKSLQGTVNQTTFTQFETASFVLSQLGPNKRKRVAFIEATAVARFGKSGLRVDQIGRVQASSSVDLSRFRIETSGSLTYIKSA